jgi:ABC-type amino acid transport substrate-binding protein
MDRAATIAVVLLLLMLALMAAAPLGFRLKWWSATTALTKLVAGGLVAGLAAALAALFELLTRGGDLGGGERALLAAIVLIAALAVLLPLRAKRIAAAAPIRDITSDPGDPPAFIALRAARERDGAHVAYEGERVASIQRQRYGDIGPWYQASDRTRLFGFIDDVAVRLKPEGQGSRVDIRSASRVGVSDLGKNAQRIRAYFAALKAHQG